MFSVFFPRQHLSFDQLLTVSSDLVKLHMTRLARRESLDIRAFHSLSTIG